MNKSSLDDPDYLTQNFDFVENLEPEEKGCFAVLGSVLTCENFLNCSFEKTPVKCLKKF